MLVRAVAKSFRKRTDDAVWSNSARDGIESCVGRVAEDEVVAIEVCECGAAHSTGHLVVLVETGDKVRGTYGWHVVDVWFGLGC